MKIHNISSWELQNVIGKKSSFSRIQKQPIKFLIFHVPCPPQLLRPRPPSTPPPCFGLVFQIKFGQMFYSISLSFLTYFYSSTDTCPHPDPSNSINRSLCNILTPLDVLSGVLALSLEAFMAAVINHILW